jgi:hypothetical protein
MLYTPINLVFLDLRYLLSYALTCSKWFRDTQFGAEAGPDSAIVLQKLGN